MPRHSAPQQPSRLRPRLLVTLVVAATGLGFAIYLPSRNDTADASERSRGAAGFLRERNRERPPVDAFADSFDGRSGSTVDPAKWAFATNRADNGLEFSESTRNASLDGEGKLVLTARADDGNRTSARLLTKNSFQRESGVLEARIKVTGGDGIEPALELVGTGRSDAAINLLAAAVPGDFHTYAVSWTPSTITLTVDGADVRKIDAAGVQTDQQFGLALSLRARNSATLPASMVVDFVKIAGADGDGATPAPSESATAAPSESPSAEPSATPSESPSATPSASTPPYWEPFKPYTVGQVISFEGANYEVLEAHTSLPGWEPTAVPSLFKKL
ncbi:carbohydrate-binding protein [Winogradskya humida]|uniref:GH16 domain-containing protein n=1 Tax=Winogradskya humida TaxID=113566 RepID=A0ABQ3ZWY4_9ACTN|nr:carbohydrate-binding protein [Actinoplanes humidus]GIE22702.1 hypothetical protein Ahu01nite_058040 [Actinoplanes humidus]